MRRLVVPVLIPLLAGCDAFSADVNTVATAGKYELRVDRLAQIMAEGKSLALRVEVAQQVARLWVDYAILAQSIAERAPLYDSALVVSAMWRDVQQMIADRYYDQVIAPVANLDTAQVDSAFNGQQFRYVRHILVRVDPTAPPDQKQQRLQLARSVREMLDQGVSWDTLNAQYNDDRSRSAGGTIGLVTRGQTVPQFDSTAFSLQPGEISDVVESDFGFHIIWRPALEAVYEDFKYAVEDKIISLADTTFLENLSERNNVRVDNDAPAHVREGLRDLNEAKESSRTLGRYDGGRFTLADFVRWFQGFPQQIQSQVPYLDDANLKRFIGELITNHLLIEEARDNGIELMPDDFQLLYDMYVENLGIVRATMNITDESLGDSAVTAEERYRQLELRVDQYLLAIAKNERTFVSVPPYLADSLRVHYRWGIVPAGVERVVQRAVEIRSALPPDNADMPALPPEIFNQP